jgi:hypothetical protein
MAMRALLVLVIVLLNPLLPRLRAQQATTDPAIRQKSSELQKRIDAKDYSAFDEARELPGENGLRFIWAYAWGRDPETTRMAREALKQVHGFKEYFQEKMGRMADLEADLWTEFEMLGMIGNPEAVETVAPYLFDRRTVHDGSRVVAAYNQEAAWAMGKMNLADAPVMGPSLEGGFQYVIDWQKWAIAHGIVPKEWSAKVGLSDWQNKALAIARQNIENFQKNEGHPVTDPGEARRIGPPKPGDKSGTADNPSGSAPLATMDKAGERTPLRGGWVLWAEVAAALAAAAGWLLLRSKGKGRKG